MSKRQGSKATAAAVPDSGKTDATANSKLADFAKAQAAKEAKAKTPKIDKSGMVKLPPLPRKAGAKKPEKECDCGCGLMTRSKFYPGHDSRLKGWAIRVARGVIKLEDIAPPYAAPGEQAKVREYIAKLKKDGLFEALKTPTQPKKKAAPANA